MATIASMVVKILGENSGFTKSMRGSVKEVKRFDSQLKRTQQVISRFTQLVGVGFTTRAIVDQFNQARHSIDALAKSARKLGVDIRDLQVARMGGNIMAGMADREVDVALQRFTRRVAEAAAGTGEAVKALQEMGLSAQKLAGMGLAGQLKAFGDAIQRFSSADQLRLAFKLFDSEGAAMVNFLREGTKGWNDMAEAAARTGRNINEVTARAVEAMNDRMTELGLTWESRIQRATAGWAQMLGFERTAQDQANNQRVAQVRAMRRAENLRKREERARMHGAQGQFDIIKGLFQSGKYRMAFDRAGGFGAARQTTDTAQRIGESVAKSLGKVSFGGGLGSIVNAIASRGVDARLGGGGPAQFRQQNRILEAGTAEAFAALQASPKEDEQRRNTKAIKDNTGEAVDLLDDIKTLVAKGAGNLFSIPI